VDCGNEFWQNNPALLMLDAAFPLSWVTTDTGGEFGKDRAAVVEKVWK